MSTYGGMVRLVPIIPIPVAAASTLKRGNLVEISAGLAVSWGGTNPLFGVATNDANNDINTIDVLTGKGQSFQVLCDTGIVPTIGQLLYWSAAGVVKITGTAGTHMGRAIAAGLNGYVEAVFAGSW